MAIKADGEPLLADTAATWNGCWDIDCENIRAGDPFKTAYSYGTNAEGKRGFLQWNRDGRLEFIEDEFDGKSFDSRSTFSPRYNKAPHCCGALCVSMCLSA